jgi:hypothetical protein
VCARCLPVVHRHPRSPSSEHGPPPHPSAVRPRCRTSGQGLTQPPPLHHILALLGPSASYCTSPGLFPVTPARTPHCRRPRPGPRLSRSRSRCGSCSRSASWCTRTSVSSTSCTGRASASLLTCPSPWKQVREGGACKAVAARTAHIVHRLFVSPWSTFPSVYMCMLFGGGGGEETNGGSK